METTEKLFSDFGPVTKDQWKAKAIEDLKGADFDRKLVWKTDDDFNVQPFYTPEDVENDLLKAQQKWFAAGKRAWTNYTEIKVAGIPEANALALEMKKFGASGFLFKIESTDKIDIGSLLKGLDPEHDAISFSSVEPSPLLITLYLEFLEKNKFDKNKVSGFFESDVLETWITDGVEPDFNSLAEALRATKHYPNFKGLTIRSHAFANAGSNTRQEIAFTFNKLTDYIDKLSERGLKPHEVFGEIMLHIAITGDYFFEIAKLRAIRVLLNSITSLYSCNSNEIKILSSNSLWSKSLYDPNVNMLRNTTEAMSAILGGCDALLTYPHDNSYKAPSAFSHRIALNISNLIKDESYFDKVSDPAAGSYYIENLTHSLTDSALNLFKEIEDKAGFIAAFKSGIIQEKINAIKNKKEKEIATRKRVYVGTNKYPNLQEKPTSFELKSTASQNGIYSLLKPQRVTKIFDELRNKTNDHFAKTGFIPKVFLACFGNLAMRKARASFASEFFGTAGFEITGEFFFDDAQKAAKESASSKADIVVICSSDQDYETQASAFVKTFKVIAKEKSLVLAGYPESLIEELKKAGIDEFIHVKSNAIEVLSGFQNKLLKTGLV